ncbi:MAG TPA: carboxypeptidase regulatory-like domain-containing protein, partial [Longimicrobiales bacterium]|nr:carboxypeptidase regulatory-like domain-containing protein [Longimicrobiales bacterium]
MKWNGFARTLCGSRAAAGMFLLVALGVLTAGPAAGQATGALAGSVTTEAGAPLRGAMVSVAGYDARTFTGEGGAYRLELPAGTHEVRVTLLGYGNASRTVRVAAGEVTRVAFTLEERPVELTGMRISVLRPDMRPQDELEEREVREANPRDVGEALRVLPGVDAVRRGPLGLDPVVRGLRETEVGVYVDGTRQFPAGPGRMDAALTHVDPTALRSVQVVKGPYALTWGAGNMGAIRVETQAVPPTVPGAFRGRFLTGYDTNLQATETAATLYGSQDRLAYWLHGAWREGDDYETGGEVVVPAGYLSREVRGKLGYRVAPESWLAVSGGYQAQDDLDYPGRMLDAAYFHAWNLNGRWNWEPATGTVRSVEAMAYVNRVDH